MDIEISDNYMGDDECENVPEAVQLEKNDNLKELEVLRQEIDFMIQQGIDPPKDWYRIRHNNIQIYSGLGWSAFAKRFDNIDYHLQNTALNIMNNIEDLLEEFDDHGYFNLRYYQHLIHDIENMWHYYTTTYIGDETDLQVSDLIIDLSHILSKM